MKGIRPASPWKSPLILDRIPPTHLFPRVTRFHPPPSQHRPNEASYKHI